jgi:hypothetical protein
MENLERHQSERHFVLALTESYILEIEAENGFVALVGERDIHRFFMKSSEHKGEKLLSFFFVGCDEGLSDGVINFFFVEQPDRKSVV